MNEMSLTARACRDALTELDLGEGGLPAAPAADSVWTELCEQNWRVRS